jgi:hypothetical protein
LPAEPLGASEVVNPIPCRVNPVARFRGDAARVARCFRPQRAASPTLATWLVLGRSSHHHEARDAIADNCFRTNPVTAGSSQRASGTAPVAGRKADEQRCRRRGTYAALPTSPAHAAPVRRLDLGEGDRAAGLALTIQIVANQQPDAVRKQQRGV